MSKKRRAIIVPSVLWAVILSAIFAQVFYTPKPRRNSVHQQDHKRVQKLWWSQDPRGKKFGKWRYWKLCQDKFQEDPDPRFQSGYPNDWTPNRCTNTEYKKAWPSKLGPQILSDKLLGYPNLLLISKRMWWSKQGADTNNHKPFGALPYNLKEKLKQSWPNLNLKKLSPHLVNVNRAPRTMPYQLQETSLLRGTQYIYGSFQK